MNQHPFTAARAEQHRADLMADAQRARDTRHAKAARRRGLRLGLRGAGRPQPLSATAPLRPAPSAG